MRKDYAKKVNYLILIIAKQVPIQYLVSVSATGTCVIAVVLMIIKKGAKAPFLVNNVSCYLIANSLERKTRRELPGFHEMSRAA